MIHVQPTTATAEVLAQSISLNGEVLTTVQVTMARSGWAEMLTHRMLSRNAQSSRAMPVHKAITNVQDNPYFPRAFSKNQKGMHANEFVTPGHPEWDDCVSWWSDNISIALEQAKRALVLGLHKQEINRILEPYMMHTAIISATDWDNLFDLRLAKDDKGAPLAYLPVYDATLAIKEAIDNSVAHIVSPGQWHTPLVGFEGDEALSDEVLRRVSVARCARVSYLTHDGKRDVEADLRLYERLLAGGHMSPFEHVATPKVGPTLGNFTGWEQLRHRV